MEMLHNKMPTKIVYDFQMEININLIWSYFLPF